MMKVLNVSGAAELLGMTTRAVRARVARGTIPYRKWVGKICFIQDELESFMTSLPGCDLDEAVRNEERRRSE